MTNPPDPKTKTPIYPTPCLICGKPVEDYIAEYCCGGQDCGCLGLPIEPCLCSKECSAALFDNDGTMEERRIKAGIATAPTYAALELENQSLTRRLEEAEKERDAYRSEVVSVINHLPSNCIVHVTDLPAQESDCATLAVSVAKLAAKLTALRTAAELENKQ